MKRHAWRWGANAWTVPGLGCYVTPEGPGVVLQAFKVDHLVAKGVVDLGDVPVFLETDTGGKVLEDPSSWAIVDLRGSNSLA